MNPQELIDEITIAQNELLAAIQRLRCILGELPDAIANTLDFEIIAVIEKATTRRHEQVIRSENLDDLMDAIDLLENEDEE